MKAATKIVFYALFIFFCTYPVLCPAQADQQDPAVQSMDNAGESKKPKPFVIYYSRTGNTWAVADTIAEVLGGDLQEIRDMKDRSGLLGFVTAMIDVRRSPMTDISPAGVDLKDYNPIILCSPVWSMRFAPAITTIMKSADFKGKKVIFIAVASGRMSDTTINEYIDIIKNKGGKVTDTCLIKTMFKGLAEIKEAARKAAEINGGRWVK